MKVITALGLSTVFCGLVAWSYAETPPTEAIGSVLSVADGDTLTVFDTSKTVLKVRLEGIDAPELTQSFGMEAKRALSKKLFEKQVKLRITGKDKYNRLLAHVYLDDRWINKEMVSDGWAWHFKKYSSDKQLADAEIEARNAPRGLWVDEQPLSPWDFRDSIASSSTPSPEPKKTFISPSPSNTPPSRIATAISQPQPQRSGETVYITKTGSKYHSSGCRFLSKSKIPISLEEAKARYSPCSVCGS